MGSSQGEHTSTCSAARPEAQPGLPRTRPLRRSAGTPSASSCLQARLTGSGTLHEQKQVSFTGLLPPCAETPPCHTMQGTNDVKVSQICPFSEEDGWACKAKLQRLFMRTTPLSQIRLADSESCCIAPLKARKDVIPIPHIFTSLMYKLRGVAFRGLRGLRGIS